MTVAGAIKGTSLVAGSCTHTASTALRSSDDRRRRSRSTSSLRAAEDATHRALSIIGSKHRLSRRAIHIDGVDQIDPRTSLDPNVINTFRDEIEVSRGPITSSEE